MNKYTYLKIALSLIAVFVAGSLTGGFVMLHVCRNVAKAYVNPQNYTENLITGLTYKLNLTDDQKAKIRPVLETSSEKLRKLQLERGAVVESTISEARDKILPILNEEQKANFLKMDAIRRERQSNLYK